METMIINGIAGKAGVDLRPRSFRPLELRRRDERASVITGVAVGSAPAADRGAATTPATDVAFPAVRALG